MNRFTEDEIVQENQVAAQEDEPVAIGGDAGGQQAALTAKIILEAKSADMPPVQYLALH